MKIDSCINLLEAQPSWIILLSSLGFLTLLRAAIAPLSWVYSTFLRPGKDLKSSYGSWALVTGATDGIGKAIALQLARRGLHLLEAEIEGLDVGLLVNSAGTTYPHAMFFHEVEEELWRSLVRVNVEATTRVTRAVLPGMLRRRRGAVVNIGSAASAVLPSFPFSAVYAATKAYIDQFSRSLFAEYKRMGIDVQCQIPFYVATKMVSMKQSSTFVPSPDEYAKAAVDWIGYGPRCTPYWSHSLQWCFTCFIPDFVLDLWRLHVGITNRNQACILRYTTLVVESVKEYVPFCAEISNEDMGLTQNAFINDGQDQDEMSQILVADHSDRKIEIGQK
ncbi:short chain dehydrogenase [Musa troglodytarum]|uniref:Short chain dehydrogenase n=1 Tax=Musa troglodytarum TaxID=320322 RepID=A0A9E7I6M7_9LILI|nr:short chain dehydrogenase [Musa troglodytarum]